MQFSAKFVALIMAATSVQAHLRMTGSFTPSDAANPAGPLLATGTDYPCSTSFSGGTPMSVAKGTQHQIALVGSAVHSGGSCQISITYDKQPNKSSAFKVIKSFQGNCPVPGPPGGNFAANAEMPLPGLPYSIPDDAPAGDAIIAWTWFNKSGNREMYMRCAPIKITGSAGDKSKFSGRPDILKANIGNGCSTLEGTEINFPAPGDTVVGKGNGSPQGNCGPSGSTAPAKDTTTTTPKQTTPKPADDTKTTTPAKPAAPVTTTPKQTTGGSCTPGTVVCLSGGSKWAMCGADGKQIDMGSVAGGTKCSGGQMIPARRRVRRTMTERA
jgi:hypothetical protein